MFNLTPEERKAAVFLIILGLSGLILNNLSKAGIKTEKLVFTGNTLGKIDLNKARLEELAQARHVSPGLARQILAYRERYGDFSDLEQLKEIKGIKEKRYQQLKEVFFIEGM